MSNYLLEIGTEELPANFSNSVINQIYSLIEFEFDKKLIKYKNVISPSTPRRIVLFLEGLVDQADDQTVIRKGPKATSAYLNGVPTNAAIGFANSLGMSIDDLEIKNTEKGEFVFGKKIEKLFAMDPPRLAEIFANRINDALKLSQSAALRSCFLIPG